MSDQACSWSPTPYRMVASASCWVWAILIVTRLATHGGSRRSPGYLQQRKIVLCPACAKKVRLQADGRGYCRKCRLDFDGRKAKEA
jgi:hypothetical protein